MAPSPAPVDPGAPRFYPDASGPKVVSRPDFAVSVPGLCRRYAVHMSVCMARAGGQRRPSSVEDDCRTQNLPVAGVKCVLSTSCRVLRRKDNPCSRLVPFAVMWRSWSCGRYHMWCVPPGVQKLYKKRVVSWTPPDKPELMAYLRKRAAARGKTLPKGWIPPRNWVPPKEWIRFTREGRLVPPPLPKHKGGGGR